VMSFQRIKKINSLHMVMSTKVMSDKEPASIAMTMPVAYSGLWQFADSHM
jgi:hypothetical protein